MQMEIKTLIPCAIGYGNRPADFVLADIESDNILESIEEIRTKRSIEIDSGTVNLRDGVQPIEVVNGMLNNNVCHIGQTSQRPTHVGPSIDKSLLPDFMPPGSLPAQAAPANPQPAHPPQPTDQPNDSWQAIGVNEVSEFNPLLRTALLNANPPLRTLGDINDFVHANGDLKTVSGIQEQNEKHILLTIQGIMAGRPASQ